MLDMREIGRAFILAGCGTVVVVGIFVLLINAHPANTPITVIENLSAVSQDHRLPPLVLRQQKASKRFEVAAPNQSREPLLRTPR